MSLLGFSVLENDAFTEIINIGMGRAADALSQMVGEEVSLSVPVVDVVEANSAADELEKIVSAKISGVTQEFRGTLSGRAMLLFPEKQSMNLVRLLLKDSVPLEMMSEMEKEALTEVGNIILNACFGTVANTLNFDLESTIPDFVNGSSQDLITEDAENHAVLMLQVDFSLPSKDIQGFVTFLMDISSSDILKERITKFVSGFAG